MTVWRDQPGMQTAQRQPFCFYRLLTTAVVVTVLRMVSAATNEANTTDAIVSIDTFSTSASVVANTEASVAFTSLDVNVNNFSSLSPTINTKVPDDIFNIIDVNISITDPGSTTERNVSTAGPTTNNSPSIYISPNDSTKLFPFTDTPLEFNISVEDISGVRTNYAAANTNPNPSATISTVDTTSTTNSLNDVLTLSSTNTTSDSSSFDFTSLDAVTTTPTDNTRTRNFVTDISVINFTDIITAHFYTTTPEQMNITDPSNESTNSILSTTNVTPNVISFTKATTINSFDITPSINSVNVTSSADGEPNIGCALTKCQEFYSSHRAPLENLSWWTKNDAEDWVTFNRTTAEGRQLVNTIRIHELATVEEGAEWTVVCVGVMYLAAFSHRNSTMAMPDAEIEMQTSRDVAIGFVRLRTRCWLDTGFFAECSPSFIPMVDLSFYNHSPFDEEFWMQLTNAVVEVKDSWIRRINITTLQGSISSQIIYNMHIPSLEYLHIIGNDWNVTDRILGNMSKLIHLDLSNNNIHSLPEEIFHDMQSLETLILEKNSLLKCPSSLSQLIKLIRLDLSNSVGNSNLRIEKEDIKRFSRSIRSLEASNANLQVELENILLLPELRFLNVTGNRVKMRSAPSNTSKVEILDVSENKLLQIPDNFFSEMPSLKILILNQNHLYELPDFPKQNNITQLYASQNLLVSLSSTTFTYLKKLEILDVSRCRIEFLESPFENTFSLRKVNLSHNLIRYINNYSLTFLPKLQEVDFSHNYLKTVYLWKWKLKKLDLSWNRLIDFRSNMSAIEYVDFSFNHMQHIDNTLSSVQILNISHNSLSYISPELWKNISQSLVVDLGGNYFLCCSFKDSAYLRDHYYTEILNLGSFEPVRCHINPEVSKMVFETPLYDRDKCRTAKESITSFMIVLPVIIAITFAAVLGILTMYVIQFGRRKFVIEHSLDSVQTSTTI